MGQIQFTMPSRVGRILLILPSVFCFCGYGVPQLRDPVEITLTKTVERVEKQDESLSKIQVSFRTPLLKSLPLYFGYTQLMFWDLHADSKPFRDLTYNPELFYRQKIAGLNFLKSIDLTPFNHTSNGKDNDESRSFNRTSIRANFEKDFSSFSLAFYMQLSHLYTFDKHNEDIDNYIGPYALGFSIFQLFDFWIDKSELSLQLVPGGLSGKEISSGGYQASLSFRPGGFDIVPALYFQYYRGYAETFLNYNDRVEVFRVGFIF
jgi:phospholipase A1/A2